MENSQLIKPPETTSMFFKDQVALEQQAPGARRGVIYARYSSDMQDTSDSIEVQISACKKYALAHDITIGREPFIDRAETGTSTENRKSYQQLLALAQSLSHDFEVVLTFHTSRWGRGIESEIDEYLLEKNGVKIISVSQPFTADDNVESMFMKGVLRKIDAYYSMQQSKYTHAYQTSNAENGYRNGGAAPDGYSVEHIPTGKKDKRGFEKMKSRLILDIKPGCYDTTDLPRHKLIEYVFTHAHQGKGLRWLSKAVYRMGWWSRYHKDPISYTTLRTWLINPAYTGYVVWNRVKFFRRHGKRNYTHNPISKWVFSTEPSHPAIISKEVFEPVAVKFLHRRGGTKGRPPADGRANASPDSDNRGRFLLSGLLICATCKANYVAAKNLHRAKRTQVYYVCNTKWRRGRDACPSQNINLAVAEGAAMQTLLHSILTEGEIKQFIDAFNLFMEDQAERSDRELQRIAKEKEQLQVEMDRIKRAILNGVESKSFTQELNQRQTLLDSLEAEGSAFKAMNSKEQITYDPARLTDWVQTIKNNFMAADYETRREMVRQFVKKIEVRPDKSAEMTWDPEAILRLADGPRIPRSVLMVMKNTCGGRLWT